MSPRAIVFGGYGVFGTHVCRELAADGIAVTVCGRDGARAEALAQELGPAHGARRVDVTDRACTRAALEGHAVAVGCAGPFSSVGATLLDACLDAGCHHADIADDRGYAAEVRRWDERFRSRGLSAAYGCSSLPSISGALALLAREAFDDPPERARVTLFIGNDNPKGAAAIRSLALGLGRPIEAPQGALHGFREREVVDLPPPFGRRAVYSFESPDYDLLPALVGVRSVAVKVGFELRLATRSFAILSKLGWRPGNAILGMLDATGGLLRGIGCSGGAVMSELFWPGGRIAKATLWGAEDGQRAAALPCALAAAALARGEDLPRGARTAYELLGARRLLDALAASGFSVEPRGEPPPSPRTTA